MGSGGRRTDVGRIGGGHSDRMIGTGCGRLEHTLEDGNGIKRGQHTGAQSCTSSKKPRGAAV